MRYSSNTGRSNCLIGPKINSKSEFRAIIIARITSPTRIAEVHCIKSCLSRLSAARTPCTAMMKTISESAPPEPTSSLLYSYNNGKMPEVIATTENIIPLFALNESHIDSEASDIMDIPSSQETIFPDQSIQILDPINAITNGVNVVTDQPNVVTPFNFER